MTRTPLIMLLSAGCDRSPFTDREWERLAHFLMVEEPPGVPENAWADDDGARQFGEVLFHDPSLSGPLAVDSELGEAGDVGRVACATCHDLDGGGADARHTPTSMGADWGPRNAPSLLNVAYREAWSWGGEFLTMRQQNLSPMVDSTVAMNTSEIDLACAVAERYSGFLAAVFDWRPEPLVGCGLTGYLDGDELYASLVDEAKAPIDEVTGHVGRALEAYLRSFRSCDSAFDRLVCDGEPDAMNEAAIRGAKLFVGRAECIQCHWSATLADGELHTIGVPSDDPGEYGAKPSPGRKEADALGRFQTPSLRNVSLTGPYMHDGSYETLQDVVEFYRYGGESDGYPGVQDPKIRPLALDDDDVKDLVAFLEALEGTAGGECPRACVR